jgi:hypothetical protein
MRFVIHRNTIVPGAGGTILVVENTSCVHYYDIYFFFLSKLWPSVEIVEY